MTKDKQIAQLRIANRDYSIRATTHALERMEERQVDEEIITADILALGKDRIKELQEANEEAAIIDEDSNITLIVGFKKNTMRIITVIDKTNIWTKQGTKVEKLYK